MSLLDIYVITLALGEAAQLWFLTKTPWYRMGLASGK